MQIDAILLAAGRGTRLAPLTDLVPKPAVPVLDIPLGVLGLGALRTCGHIVVNASHRAQELERRFRDAYPSGHFELFDEGDGPLGTAATLRALAERLSPTIVTHNADIVTDVEIPLLLETHAARGTAGTVAVRFVNEGADFVVEDGRVTELIDRRSRSVPGYQFIGIAALQSVAIERARENAAPGLTEALLFPLIESGELTAHVHEGYFQDAGTPAGYLKATLDLLTGLGRALPVGIPGVVFDLEEGLAYVGRDADVKGAALGPGAVVLTGARLGQDTSVRESIVWPGEEVPPGTQLNRCIWAQGRAIGALTNTA